MASSQTQQQQQQQQHSVLAAAVFPSFLPLSYSLPNAPAIFGQIQEPLVYSYIVAPNARRASVDRSASVSTKASSDGHLSMEFDSKPSSPAQSRFAIE
jgi:hypothetical protein